MAKQTLQIINSRCPACSTVIAAKLTDQVLSVKGKNGVCQCGRVYWIEADGKVITFPLPGECPKFLYD